MACRLDVLNRSPSRVDVTGASAALGLVRILSIDQGIGAKSSGLAIGPDRLRLLSPVYPCLLAVTQAHVLAIM